MGINYITTTAEEARAAFTTEIGNNGEEFTNLREGAPEWLADAVYLAHEGQLPDNRIFELAADACEQIAAANTCARSLYDRVRSEFADGAVDTYNADRLAWLESNAYRVALVDEVHEDYGRDSGDLMDQIAEGQYDEAARVFDYIAAAIEEEADERENEQLMADDIERGDAWEGMAPAQSLASVVFGGVAS